MMFGKIISNKSLLSIIFGKYTVEVIFQIVHVNYNRYLKQQLKKLYYTILKKQHYTIKSSKNENSGK